MKRRLTILALAASISFGATPVVELAPGQVLLLLADRFERQAGFNAVNAMQFELVNSSETAARFRGRSEAFTEAAAQIREEIVLRYPSLLPTSPNQGAHSSR